LVLLSQRGRRCTCAHPRNRSSSSALTTTMGCHLFEQQGFNHLATDLGQSRAPGTARLLHGCSSAPRPGRPTLRYRKLSLLDAIVLHLLGKQIS
jgi:hypothetical protein